MWLLIHAGIKVKPCYHNLLVLYYVQFHYGFPETACDLFTHRLKGCFTGTRGIPRLPRRHCDIDALQWCHNERDGVSNHQPRDCLINRLFRRRSKKTPKLRVTGLCAGNSPVTGDLPTQMVSNAGNVSIWWRHHGASVNLIGTKPQQKTAKRELWAYFFRSSQWK